ncbi:interferon gamma receptor 2 [Pholidichthys leucotaenia]
MCPRSGVRKAGGLLLVLVVVQSLIYAVCPQPLSPPTHVVVDWYLLTWHSGSGLKHSNENFTVEYQRGPYTPWEHVPYCVRIPGTSCNVSSMAAYGCVNLRVRAERWGLSSKPTEACSQHGESCFPEFSLSAHSGSLTIHLDRNNCMADEYADHAKYQVFFGRKGTKLKFFRDTLSSLTIPNLEAGHHYCVQVRYLVMHEEKGVPSGLKCELVPTGDSSWSAMIGGLVALFILLVMVSPITYIIVFQREKIKKWIQSFFETPEITWLSEHDVLMVSSPAEEHCDVITSLVPQERGTGPDSAHWSYDSAH